MIRLGSLAGYPFEGPRVLAGWTPPAIPAVYAIMSRSNPEGKPQEFSVIFVGQTDNLTNAGFPFKNPNSPAWIKRSGDRFNLYICYYEIPGGLQSHRELITQELIAIYHPSCNVEQYDRAWNDEWIGEYKSITTEMLTTDRDPNSNK